MQVFENPYRVLGVFTTDGPSVMMQNLNKIHVLNAVGRDASFPADMGKAFKHVPDRCNDRVDHCLKVLSSPMKQLCEGMFWFMNLNDTDAEAFRLLNTTGNLRKARQLWEKEGRGVSALQNRLVCCIAGGVSFKNTIPVIDELYTKHAQELADILTHGMVPLASEQVLNVFFEKLINIFHIPDIEEVIDQYGDKTITRQWFDARVSVLQRQLESHMAALDVEDCNDVWGYLEDLQSIAKKHAEQKFLCETIAESVSESILDQVIKYYNESHKTLRNKDLTLMICRRCRRFASTKRFSDRCTKNINTLYGKSTCS